ncbi:outer membrane protein assembly factor BamB family protein [Algoriphagus machipongonensis]|uniref:outer membrane protein assembly factor BamB family protein n=1 Tax=Algoriphagus machipongonensis TaxID=388413 RepID=UPI00031A8A46|nr:PQQ-binding-like beta-propeller repeat protein [Algoriphagus machipongonensis]
MKTPLLLLVLICLGQASFAQLKGNVYWDENSNGRKDPSENGVANAVISDGLHVIRTDKDGSFQLEGWEKQQFVTIYPAADFDSPIRYQAILPNINSYDFGVLKKAKNDQVSFAHISDTETFEYGDWVDNLKKYVKTEKPDFIVHTGDICYESGMKWHSENLTEKELGVPIYYCLGNHDLIKGERGEAYFESKFGPAWYAFEAGNVLYVITPMMGGDYPPGFDHQDIGTWMKNLFETYPSSKTKFFFNHDLLTSEEKFEFKINDSETLDLNEQGLKAWFFGHLHMNMTKAHGASGIRSFGTASLPQGGIDHSPSSFREVHVDSAGNIESQMRWTYLNRELEVVNPSRGIGMVNEQNEISLSVNVYDTGSKVDSIRYKVFGPEGFNWTNSINQDNWEVMRPQSDWNWQAKGKIDTLGPHTLVLDAYLSSGEVIHRRARFSAERQKIANQNSLDWKNLGGNESHQAFLTESLKAPYQLQWTANIGSNIYMSSPLLADQFVISSSFDDGNARECYVVCWDANTGKEIWRNKTRNGVKNQMVIADGQVIATDMEGITYSFSLDQGLKLWEKDLGYRRKFGFVSGIVTDGETVFTGFAESLTALNPTTGHVKWKANKSKGGYGSTATMTLAGKLLLVNRQWGGMDALDKETGEYLWSREDDGLRFRDGVLTFADGYLWVAGRSGSGESKLFQLSVETGETISSMETGMMNTGTSTPIVLKDQFILAGSHPGVVSFDKDSGKKQWEFEVDPALFYTPSYFSDQQQSIESTPILVGDHLIFGAMDGKLYVLEANSGKLIWKTHLGAPIMTSAAISENGFFICDFAGNIYYFLAMGNTQP